MSPRAGCVRVTPRGVRSMTCVVCWDCSWSGATLWYRLSVIFVFIASHIRPFVGARRETPFSYPRRSCSGSKTRSSFRLGQVWVSALCTRSLSCCKSFRLHEEHPLAFCPVKNRRERSLSSSIVLSWLGRSRYSLICSTSSGWMVACHLSSGHEATLSLVLAGI